jgi:hypothetical protein
MKVQLIGMFLISTTFIHVAASGSSQPPTRIHMMEDSFPFAPHASIVFRPDKPYKEHDTILEKMKKSFESGFYAAIECLPQLVFAAFFAIALRVGASRVHLFGEGGL